MTPEQIAEQIVIDYNTQAHPGWILCDYLAAALQSYGAACAAAERERCADVASRRAFDWRAILEAYPDSILANDRWGEACDIATSIRALD